MGLTVQGSVGIGTVSPAQKLQVSGGKAQADDFCLNSPTDKCLSSSGGKVGFGAWTPDNLYKLNTVYQAATDGFVVARHVSSAQDENCTYVFRTDSTADPQVIRGAFGNANDGASHTMTVLVRKNDYWKIGLNSGGNCVVQSIYWLPLVAQ